MRFIIRVVVNAFAIWVVTLIPALQVTVIPFAPGETLQLVLTLLLVAAIFAVVNTIIGTVVKILAFPLYILTLGLISLIINGFLLWLTGVDHARGSELGSHASGTSGGVWSQHS